LAAVIGTITIIMPIVTGSITAGIIVKNSALVIIAGAFFLGARW
jgi:hypothetical protein